MITIVALIALAVVACYLCRIWEKSREKHMTTEGFRNYYNKMMRDQKDYIELMKELNRRDKKR